MPSPLLLVTEVPVDPASIDDVVRVWSQQLPSGGRLYTGVEAPTVLELTPIADLARIDDLAPTWTDLTKAITPMLTGDVRRQVLSFVEAPKPVDGELPTTPYVQLRHVEVRPPVLEEYRTWRDGTIFDVVRTTPEVEAFLAYHSVLSTEPGVMFVAGFSCPPEEYLPAFSSERYAEISRFAHGRYVTETGLYTRVYRSVTAGEQ
jgi:hypothetical protein